MPDWMEADHDWNDDADGPDQDDEYEVDEDGDEEPTVACPFCGREIHEDAQPSPLRAIYLRGRRVAYSQAVVDRRGRERVPLHRLPLDRRIICANRREA